MKIGILTFHKSINYGSVYQCLALQDTLRNIGYDVEIIDYEPQKYKQMYKLFGRRNPVNKIRQLPLAYNIYKQNNEFSKFRNRYLLLSKEKYYFDSDFQKLTEYDAIICGSDQIWNLNAEDCDPIFFLPNIRSIRKIAYAVSVNNCQFESNNKDMEGIRNYIRDFDYISCRERSGAKKIQKYIRSQNEVEVMLDPTLLHNMNYYDEICSRDIFDHEYIFLYNVWSEEDGYKSATIISEKYGMPVYAGFMTRSYSKIKMLRKKGVCIDTTHVSPSDFLSLIKNAKYVVTDSFHGTAFSLIFEKRFVCINSKKSDGSLKNDERIINILSKVGLIDRYITANQIENFDINQSINYEKITKELFLLANDCIQKIKSVLEDDK